MSQGIETRHKRDCRSRSGGRCNCTPSYRASVWSTRDRKLIRKTFPTIAAAKSWWNDAQHDLRRGRLRVPVPTTVREAAEEWLAGARTGAVGDRSGRPYKPSTLRGYEQALRDRVLPALGDWKLSELRRTDVQALVDRLAGEGLSAGTIRNQLDPLRAIYRRAINRELVAVNPTTGLELPAARPGRDRIADQVEAAKLLDALPAGERALWATAFYTGLRRGELMALRWSDVDLGRSEIRVERSWDPAVGPIEPKSETSTRTLPLLAVLRDYLDQHKLATGRAALTWSSAARRRTRSCPRLSALAPARHGRLRTAIRSACTSAVTPSPA
jgi:integrase